MLKYRPELDGLRAVAVIAVVIFHTYPQFLPGGFLGVDVFFVLSGFLITSILWKNAAQGISLKQFWIKRIRRILPPLAGMVAFTLCLGSLFYLRTDRVVLLDHALASLLSYSNFFIWEHTLGYWAASSETLPLLHTWSLSVEEQFYIIFPLLLSALYAWGKNRVIYVLGLLAVCSWIAPGLYLSDPSTTFLMLPFRAWELLIGAILAICMWEYKLPRIRSTKVHLGLQGISLALLVYTFFAAAGGIQDMAAMALLACISTAALIYSTNTPTCFRSWLSHPVSVYLGKRSYSIYLYHWPITTFLKLYTPQPHLVTIAILSLICAEASYRWIERPFRYSQNPFRSKLNWATLTAIPASFLLVALFPHPFAISDQLRSLSLPGVANRGVEYDMPALREGEVRDIPSWGWDGHSAPDVMLAGSSHGTAMVAGLSEFCQAQGKSLVALVLSHAGIAEQTRINEARFAFAKAHSPHTVILASHWFREDFENAKAAIQQWSAVCDHLIILESPPILDQPPRVSSSLHRYLVYLDLHAQPLEMPIKPRDSSEFQAFVESIPNASWVAVTPLFSASGKSVFLPDGSYPYGDVFHLNILGIRYLIQQSLGAVIVNQSPLRCTRTASIRKGAVKGAK